MTTRMMKQFLSVLACSTLLIMGTAEGMGQQNQTPPPLPDNSQPATSSQDSSSNAAPTVALQTPDDLDTLVAPIALYPDALVAQVLAASEYPDQVAFADDWLAQNKSLTGTALAQAVNQQSWDPSVKALTQFPSVMDNLAHNLAWTSSLGQAFMNQQAEVMAAVQTMRSRAQTAGTLQSSSQITVVQQSPSTIVIKPANPQVVYVPQYNPTVVYGAPVVVPAYVPPPVPVVTGGIFFGTGVAIGTTFGGGGWGGGFGWGWNSWNVGWGVGGGNVVFNNNTYINKTVINRTTYNNYHPWGPNNPNGYHPGTDTHYGPNGAYHPNGYYGPNGGWHPDGPVNHAGDATGSENHAWYGNNGVYHPSGDYKPGTDTHYGPNGAYHPNGYYGPDGGWHEDKPGTDPHDQPNGGDNGNHGLIGGNGGVQRPAAGYGDRNNQAMPGNSDRSDDRGNFGNDRDRGSFGGDRDNAGRMNQPRSYMSGNGDRDRAAADRGRQSMHPAAMRSRPQRMSAPHNSGGGHRR